MYIRGLVTGVCHGMCLQKQSFALAGEEEFIYNPGGATTSGLDATPPELSVKTWGGGGGGGGGGQWGGVQPGVGGGSSRGSGGRSSQGLGGCLAGVRSVSSQG